MEVCDGSVHSTRLLPKKVIANEDCIEDEVDCLAYIESPDMLDSWFFGDYIDILVILPLSVTGKPVEERRTLPILFWKSHSY